MDSTTTDRRIDGSSRSTMRTGPVWRVGALASVAAAVATVVFALFAKAIDIPLEIDGEAIPVLGFAMVTLLWAAVGTGLAIAFAPRPTVRRDHGGAHPALVRACRHRGRGHRNPGCLGAVARAGCGNRDPDAGGPARQPHRHRTSSPAVRSSRLWPSPPTDAPSSPMKRRLPARHERCVATTPVACR